MLFRSPNRPRSAVGGQGLETRPRRLVHLGGMVGVNANARVDDSGVAAGQVERSLRRREIPARDADPLDPRLDGAGDHLVAVRVETGVLKVGVRVDQAGESRGDAPTAQAGTSSSTRGKIGIAVPVVQSSGPLPHASKASSPGPPAPIAS